MILICESQQGPSTALTRDRTPSQGPSQSSCYSALPPKEPVHAPKLVLLMSLFPSLILNQMLALPPCPCISAYPHLPNRCYEVFSHCKYGKEYWMGEIKTQCRDFPDQTYPYISGPICWNTNPTYPPLPWLQSNKAYDLDPLLYQILSIAHYLLAKLAPIWQRTALFICRNSLIFDHASTMEKCNHEGVADRPLHVKTEGELNYLEGLLLYGLQWKRKHRL